MVLRFPISRVVFFSLVMSVVPPPSVIARCITIFRFNPFFLASPRDSLQCRMSAYIFAGRLSYRLRLRAGVVVWDAVMGTYLQECRGHTSHVFSVAFSPDGRRPASIRRFRRFHFAVVGCRDREHHFENSLGTLVL